MIQLSKILETAIYVDDLLTARHFYSEVLGIEEHSYAEGRKIFYVVGNAMLLVFDPSITKDQVIKIGDSLVPPHGAVGRGHMAFDVTHEQIESLVKHLGEHGVEIESHIRWGNGAQSIYIRDPAGNCIEFATADLWFA